MNRVVEEIYWGPEPLPDETGAHEPVEGVVFLSTKEALKHLGLADTSRKVLRRYCVALGIPTSRGGYYTNELNMIKNVMTGAKEFGSLEKYLEHIGYQKAQEESKQTTSQAREVEKEEFVDRSQEAKEESAVALSNLKETYSNSAKSLAKAHAKFFLAEYQISFLEELAVEVCDRRQSMEIEMQQLLEGTIPSYLLESGN